MLTVEDVLETFANNLFKPYFQDLANDPWFSRFISNVHNRVIGKNPLSSEQSRVILKLARRFRTSLCVEGGIHRSALDALLHSPSYRRTPYQSANIPREVRYLGDNKLAFRFKFNDLIVADLKRLRSKSPFITQDQKPYWCVQHRLWVVSITRDTVDDIMEIITKHRFGYDHAVLEYLTLAINSKDQPSTFVLDPTTNTIIAIVRDSEFLATWVQTVLGGDILE